MKKINDIFDTDCNIFINGITDDSRKVKKGFLFVATKGFNVDHFDYIEDAISKGAACIIADRWIEIDVPLFIVSDINVKYHELCMKFYDVNPKDFDIIGITGTDGKTTTATIIYEIVKNISSIAYMGTNGLDVAGMHFDTDNTTPCISELYKCLSIIKNYNCHNIVMEVSSESLLHNRLIDFKFKMICFTNIREDHLNIHKSIDNYIKCKLSFINYLCKDGYIFINGDDSVLNDIKHDRIVRIGKLEHNDFTYHNVNNKCKSIDFKIKNLKQEYNIKSKLLGEYNIYNLTMAFAVCFYMNIDPSLISNYISNINFIKGRGEFLDFGQDFDIILDYAHTYNAIDNILNSLYNYERIIVVTGAAGGREKEKRKFIGKLLLEKSNFVIFTMDDPRFETVDSIIDDMLLLSESNNYCKILDREEAIKYSFNIAQKGDVVLIIGKGRDNYMAINDKKIPYCDYDVICKYFENSIE